MNGINNYKILLDKLELSNPVPLKIQRYAVRSGETNLKIILKKTGYYSITFSILLSLFYRLRSLGVHISLFKGKIILIVIAAAIASSGAAGGYYINEKIFNAQGQDVKHEDFEKKSEKQYSSKVDNNIYRKDRKIIPGSIGVLSFTGDQDSSTIITSKIVVNLKRMLKTYDVALMSAKDREKVPNIIMGSVNTVGDITYITARIVDAKNAEVKYIVSEEINSEKEIEEACNRISRNIADKFSRNN